MSIGAARDETSSGLPGAGQRSCRKALFAAILNAMRRPRSPDIDAFGPRWRTPAGGYVLAVLALLASLALVLLYWRNAQQRELKAAEAEFTAETGAIAELLRQRFNTYGLILRGGVSLFASVDRPSAEQWRGYVDGLDIASQYPGMVGLGYAPYVNGPALQELQVAMRDAGQGFYVVRPAGVREYYGPILYLEPKTAENVDAVGYDMFSEPVRHAAMVAARDDGRIRITGPVHLVQDAGTPATGLVMYAPVYRLVTPASLVARREALQGWVYVPLHTQALVEQALRTAQRQLALTITDATEAEAGKVLYRESLPVADAGAGEMFTRTVPLELYGRHWQLAFVADARASLAARAPELQATLLIGLAASLLLFGIALALARTESLAERKAARLSESYQRSELRFRNAMRFSAIGMALLDHKGAIVDANPALAAIFGTDTDALVGKVFGEHFVEGDGETAQILEAKAQSGGIHRTTRQLRQADGELRHVQLAYAPVPGEIGQDVTSLVQVEDVTERVQAEAREQALNRTLEARVAMRTRELTHANHELESFAYSVSHDLRAPLRSIEGFSRLLSERHAASIGEEGKDYLSRVRSAAGRMDQLIDALLKMSRVSRGPLKLAPLDLERMAREVVAELRLAQPWRQVEVAIEPGLHAIGDAVLVRNLLQNLIGNAWKFTDGKPDARIEIGREDLPGDQATFFVRDNGAGFAPDYADKLFRPFQRLHESSQFEGNGIGLATVKRIVERHGGSVGAEGIPDGGAIFRFTLPRHMPAA